MTRAVAVVAGVLALAGVWPCAAQEASFDCAGAKAAVERAICADPALADTDNSIAAVYKSALERLDGANAAALRADQRAWLAARNAAFGRGDYDLKLALDERFKMLRATYFAAYRFLGEWLNHTGSVLIKDRRGLIVGFRAGTCDNAGDPREVGDSIVLSTGQGRADENWSVRITMRGPLLVVTELPPKRRSKKTPERACTGGGSVAGVYFPADTSK
jgi:uncharacterized protein